MTDGWSRRRWATLGALVLLTAFVYVGVGVRLAYTGRSEGVNLMWNLVLAWAPLVAALLVYDGWRRGVRPPLLVAGGLVWFLFFPNAPYILTDFQHVPNWHGAPIWFDSVLVGAAAWTGLLLGFASLFLVHSIVRSLVSPALAWAGVVATIGLASFGVYLGRFLRWNSWDVLTSPHGLLADTWTRVANPSDHPGTFAVVVLLTAFLTVGYAAFYSVVGGSPERGRG
jgi:uncharacterized membrane protein